MGTLVTDPFRPSSRRALASDASSRVRAPLLVLTNRGVRAAFSQATTALARLSGLYDLKGLLATGGGRYGGRGRWPRVVPVSG